MPPHVHKLSIMSVLLHVLWSVTDRQGKPLSQTESKQAEPKKSL